MMPPTFRETFCYSLIRSRNPPTNQPEHENPFRNRHAILCSIEALSLYTAPHARILPPTQAPEPQPQPALQVPPQRAGSPSNFPTDNNRLPVQPHIEPSPTQSLHDIYTEPTTTTIPSRHRNTSLDFKPRGINALTVKGLQYQKMSPSRKSSSGSHSTDSKPPTPDGEGCLLKRVDCWGVG